MSGTVQLICHVTDQLTLDQISEEHYTCSSLKSEGFIHCCTKDQLPGVLERYYLGVIGLKLLIIDPRLLVPELIYENTVGGEELFPHVYGPINMSAVTAVENLT